ncbi:amidohydrolase family protein [Paenibacillus sp. FSL H8-0034]|uniref:amidohydrolase family protein n=1 Tax=Paenibacillus sp. FSL H8-0034 TaxID=2954671 RepID=UPI0030F58DDE
MNKRVIVDIDVHHALKSSDELLPFLPRTWHNEWKAMGVIPAHYYSLIGAYRKDAYPESGPPGSDPALMRKQLLDENGIDYAILTTDAINISVYYNPDYANAVAAAYNEWTAGYWLQEDSRFKGSILINNSDPVAAVKEIHRWGDHPDMVQIVMPSASRTLYGQRIFHPIYEAAEQYGLPIAIHPTAEGRGIAPEPTNAGYPTRYMEWHAGLSLSYIAHLISLVCEGVFEKFPDFKLIGMEGGISWLPNVIWTLDNHYKSLRSSVPWLTKYPSEYIMNQVYLTTQPLEEPEKKEYFLQILEMIHAEKTLLYSSDYPHWDFDAAKTVELSLPKHLRAPVMGETALQLFGLKRPVGKEAAE